MKCVLCKKKEGACIQCSAKKCTVPYHVTCAQLNGMDVSILNDDDESVKLVVSLYFRL